MDPSADKELESRWILLEIFFCTFFLNLRTSKSTTNERLHERLHEKQVSKSRGYRVVQGEKDDSTTNSEHDQGERYGTDVRDVDENVGWNWTRNSAELKAKSEKKLKELDEKYKDAEKIKESTKFLLLQQRKPIIYRRSVIRAMQKAMSWSRKRRSLTKIDASFNVMRNAFMHDDLDLMKRHWRTVNS